MKKKLVINIVQYVLLGILGVFLAFNIWNFIDVKSGYKAPIFGHRSLTIVSNSMSVVDPSNKDRLEGITNQFRKGDLVRTKTSFEYQDLKVNDIITFQKDNLEYCHRIVTCETRDGIRGYVTQGDANASTDGFIKFEQVNGYVYDIVPGMGNLVGFLTSGYFAAAVFIACACVFGGILIIDYGNYHKFNILEDHQKTLYEDQTLFLNPKEYDEAKGKAKKAFTYEKADNHYVMSCCDHELKLTRYIRTDYKVDDKIVSGIFAEKSLEETTLSSVLDYIASSKKPLQMKKIQKILKSKGVSLDEEQTKKVEQTLFEKGEQNA